MLIYKYAYVMKSTVVEIELVRVKETPKVYKDRYGHTYKKGEMNFVKCTHSVYEMVSCSDTQVELFLKRVREMISSERNRCIQRVEWLEDALKQVDNAKGIVEEEIVC